MELQRVQSALVHMDVMMEMRVRTLIDALKDNVKGFQFAVHRVPV